MYRGHEGWALPESSVDESPICRSELAQSQTAAAVIRTTGLRIFSNLRDRFFMLINAL